MSDRLITYGDYSAQTSKWGGFYNQYSNYDDAQAKGWEYVEALKASAIEADNIRASARAAGYYSDSMPEYEGHDIVMTLEHSLETFDRYLTSPKPRKPRAKTDDEDNDQLDVSALQEMQEDVDSGEGLSADEEEYNPTEDLKSGTEIEPYLVLVLDQSAKWEFLVTNARKYEVKVDDGVIAEDEYLRSEPGASTQIIDRDAKKRIKIGEEPYVWTVQAKKIPVLSTTIGSEIKANVAIWFLQQTEGPFGAYNRTTLREAYNDYKFLTRDSDRWAEFQRDAKAWGAREDKQYDFVAEKNTPLYTTPTGNKASGENFGATSLATADGFITVMMQKALNSGDTLTGFIHTMEPQLTPLKEPTEQGDLALKFSYSIVAALGNGSSVKGFMAQVYGKDARSVDETGLVTGEWTATSYARYSSGETYLKKGSCQVTITYVDQPVMNFKDFDQYDEYAGKETRPVYYMGK